MRRIIFITSIVIALTTATAQAQPAGGLVINEVLPGGSQSAKQEFIELLNDSESVIDVSGNRWAVQIASSTAKDWSAPVRTVYLDGFIFPHSHYLIGSTYTDASGPQAYPIEADTYFASVLSATAGHVRIIRSNDGAALTTQNALQVHQLEWGLVEKMFTVADSTYVAKTIDAGSSIERLVEADSAGTSYRLAKLPTPQSDIASQPTIELPETITDETDEDVIEPLPTTATSLMPSITELLPNPKAPQTDAADEFIELYNPSSEKLNLKGYALQTVATTPKKYTFSTDTFIDANGYAVFYAKQTKLALSNTKGQMSLLSPEGEIVSQTAVYSKAADGMAWVYVDSAWTWSATPTPGSSNIINVPAGTATATKSKTSSVTTKKAAVQKVKTVKVKQAKAPKKAKKPKVKKTTATQLAAVQSAKQPAAIHSSILVAVVILTLLYGAYEYRHDLAARLTKLRRNRNHRVRHRPTAAGRRSD